MRDTEGFCLVLWLLVGPHPSWITLDPSLMRRLDLGWKHSLEKEMATHSSILAQKIPGTEKLV